MGPFTPSPYYRENMPIPSVVAGVVSAGGDGILDPERRAWIDSFRDPADRCTALGFVFFTFSSHDWIVPCKLPPLSPPSPPLTFFFLNRAFVASAASCTRYFIVHALFLPFFIAGPPFLIFMEAWCFFPLSPFLHV